MTETAPFTELNSRKLGPVRRFFVRRPRAMDAVVVGLGSLSALASDVGSASTRPIAAALLVGTATGVALVWRRSFPLIVTGIIATVAVLSLATTGSIGGTELALAFGLYAVAVSRRPRTAWLAAVVTYGILVAAIWMWDRPGPDVMQSNPDGTLVVADDRWGNTANVLIVTLAAIAIGASVRSRREHLADLMERANAIARDRDTQAQLARAAERSRISREMHDVVAHSLSVMVTLADGAAVALDRAPDQSRVALAELSSTGRAALGDMRRVLGALADDAPLEPTGEGQDLAALVSRFRTAGLPVHAEGLLLELPSDTGLRLALYRVIQESLTNALRHAPGTSRVDVELRRLASGWEVSVTDQGGLVPPAESQGAGLGLVGMRERVELLGGTVDAAPRGNGWRVHVTIPSREESS